MVAGAPTGGAETFCLDAVKALHEQEDVQQFVLCRSHDNYRSALESRNIPHKFLSYSRFAKWWEQKTVLRAIDAFKPDIIHCWMQRAASFMPAGVNVPTLGWFGGYYDLKNYKTCDYFMGVTRDIVRHIDECTGRPDRSFVVHTFGTLEDDAPVSRAEFDIPEDAKLVLLLSRMHWKKGVDTLLEAAKQLPDEVYFLLAGDGPDLDKFKAMAADLGLESRVRFPGWRNDRAALLNIADVCTLPSRYEPFGTVIAEAWYAGVPLVAAKADGARQYVSHGADGLLCEIDDVDGLAAQLKSALYDEAVRKTIIAGGTKTYETLFSKEVVIASLKDAYQTMLKGERAKAA